VKRVLLAFLFIAGTVFAAEATDTKDLMHKLLGELTALKKYMVSNAAFKDPKNEDEIKAHLKEFTRLAKEMRHDPMLKHDNFAFSQKVLEDHISDTEKIFLEGNRAFARWKLNSTMSICLSCHSQMPAGSKTFSTFNDTSIFTSPVDRAEFLFSTHDFDQAMKIYADIISSYKKSDDSNAVETAFHREVSYFAKIKRDPNAAIELLSAQLKNAQLWPGIRKDVNGWINEFKKSKKTDVPNLKTISGEQLLAYAKKRIKAQPDLVTHLQVSGLLYEYLFKNPHTATEGEILYLLAVCDRFVNNEFFYSLADMYLKECIVRNPGTKIALKCFTQYRDETVLSYTGSAGTNVPADVIEELNKLRKIAEKKESTP
jgi:hypothetical protein